MSQQKKLEKVLDLLLSEDSDHATELLHQIIVEKARLIYEDIVDDESEEVSEADEDSNDEVGGDPSEDFTDEISSDEDEISADEENDGEAGSDDEFSDEEFSNDSEGEGEGDVDDRIEDLESQLAELRAEFDALMGEEMLEPNHADLADEFGSEDEFDSEDEFAADGEFGSDDEFSDEDSFNPASGETKVVGEVVATMFEKKKAAKKSVDQKQKMEVAKQAKKEPKGKKVEEETQFLKKVADTGQKGSAKLVGTGKDTPLGAEQGKSVFTKSPTKPSYGGKADNILGSKATGGEYGKYHGDSAKDDTPSDNVDVSPKKTSEKAGSAEGKFVGTGKGSNSGKTDVRSPLSKAPTKPGSSKG